MILYFDRLQMQSNSFFEKGWIKFGKDPVLENWVRKTLIPVKNIIAKKEHRQSLRCGGTWFAGVNILENNAHGSVDGGPVLDGIAIDFIRRELYSSNFSWDPGQISICYPGYPKPMPEESVAAFNYRVKRDAAHVDGLLPEGIGRRRHLREYHGFILGIPMLECSPKASPVVVWEGSHEFIREAFKAAFADISPRDWGNIDVTGIYQSTRREIFKCCQRVEVFARPGEAYIIHRLSLHGVAPWGTNASTSRQGRMICYFRPEVTGPWEWLVDR